MSQITWRGESPLSGAASVNNSNMAAIRGMGNAFKDANIFNKILGQRKEKEALDYERAGTDLNRDKLRQAMVGEGLKQEASQFGLDNQEKILNSKLANEMATRNAANQRAETGAYNLGQSKRIQQDTDKLSQAFLERMGSTPGDMSERQIQAGLSNFAAENNLSPQAVNSVFGNLKTRMGSTSGEQSVISTKALEDERAFKREQEKLKNKGKVDSAKAKYAGSASGGLGDATILDTVTHSTTDTFSMNPFSGWDTDADSQASAMAYTDRFKKALGTDYPDVVKKSIKNGKFDETVFNTNMKKALQTRLSK